MRRREFADQYIFLQRRPLRERARPEGPENPESLALVVLWVHAISVTTWLFCHIHIFMICDVRYFGQYSIFSHVETTLFIYRGLLIVGASKRLETKWNWKISDMYIYTYMNIREKNGKCIWAIDKSHWKRKRINALLCFDYCNYIINSARFFSLWMKNVYIYYFF